MRQYCFRGDVRARSNGNSARTQRFRGLTCCWARIGAVPSPTETACRKAKKIGARRQNREGVGRKRSLSDRGCLTQYGGVTQILSISNTHRYYTYRYKLLTELSTFRFTFAAWVSKSLYYFPPPLLLASSTLSLTILASTRSWTSTWVYSV